MNVIFLMLEELKTTLSCLQSLHESLRGSFTLHVTQGKLHFDKPQKKEIHSLNKGDNMSRFFNTFYRIQSSKVKIDTCLPSTDLHLRRPCSSVG